MLGGLTFVPVLDILIIKYKDAVPALIFGQIFRYQQCKEGYCRASYTKIGKDIAVSKSTVGRHISKLVDDCFILDVSPKSYNVDGFARRYIINQELINTVVKMTTLLKESSGTSVKMIDEENILNIINDSIKEYILINSINNTSINNIYYSVKMTTVPQESLSSEENQANEFLETDATSGGKELLPMETKKESAEQRKEILLLETFIKKEKKPKEEEFNQIFLDHYNVKEMHRDYGVPLHMLFSKRYALEVLRESLDQSTIKESIDYIYRKIHERDLPF